MSILITGMEMPKDIEPDLVIEFANSIDGKRYARLYHYRYGGLTEWLEAISIPPHGRLIDADALSKKMVSCSKRIPKDSFEWDLCGEVITQVAQALTIIPAEEGTQ